jgi:hypothetical protein
VREIAANSPQAKGRIERLWGTFQDRLVSELRLARASNIEEANLVLEKVLADHNRRFHRLPGDPRVLYRKPDPGTNLDTLFCFKYKRCVAKDNTVTFFGATVQIGPGPGCRSYAGCWVDVLSASTVACISTTRATVLKTAPPPIPPATIRVRHANGRYSEECPWTAPKQPKQIKEPPLAAAKPKTNQPHKPGPNHPWRRTWVTRSQNS